MYRYKRGPFPAGTIAGCPNGKGYVTVGFEHEQYLAHRLVWALHHDEVPEHLDHRDGDGMNNRIENLRECTQTSNNRNMKPRRVKRVKSKGVTLWKLNDNVYYRARIVVNKKEVSLGYFGTEEEAAEAYRKAAAERFGAFARAR